MTRLIRLVTKESDSYDKKCRKIKLDADGKLYLNKTIEITVMVAIFYENNKYYPQDPKIF